MPFQSQAQRGWMYAHQPAMAKRWEAETPKGPLPTHVGDSAKLKRTALITKLQKGSRG